LRIRLAYQPGGKSLSITRIENKTLSLNLKHELVSDLIDERLRTRTIEPSIIASKCWRMTSF
jgi:hypothetical protein